MPLRQPLTPTHYHLTLFHGQLTLPCCPLMPPRYLLTHPVTLKRIFAALLASPLLFNAYLSPFNAFSLPFNATFRPVVLPYDF